VIEFNGNILSRSGPEPVDTPDDWLAIPATGDETLLYRTQAVLIRLESNFKYLTIRTEGVVPVKAGGRTIGCITNITTQGETVIADLVIDRATPERLEIEEGQLYADGYFMITSMTEGYLRSSVLKEVNLVKKPHFDIPPVGQI
jgi:hypothetical protein